MYSDPVFASNNRTRRGPAMFHNTFQQDQGGLVAGALRLADGTITLAGARVNGAGSLAVTGGTGAYAGASGTYSEKTQAAAGPRRGRPQPPSRDDQVQRLTVSPAARRDSTGLRGTYSPHIGGKSATRPRSARSPARSGAPNGTSVPHNGTEVPHRSRSTPPPKAHVIA